LPETKERKTTGGGKKSESSSRTKTSGGKEKEISVQRVPIQSERKETCKLVRPCVVATPSSEGEKPPRRVGVKTYAVGGEEKNNFMKGLRIETTVGTEVDIARSRVVACRWEGHERPGEAARTGQPPDAGGSRSGSRCLQAPTRAF